MAVSSANNSLKSIRRILAFGDSLTEGYYQMGFGFHPYTIKLQEFLQSASNSSIEVINSGVSGEGTASMVSRLENELRSLEPFQLAIILGGTNDLGTNIDSESLFRRIKRLHEIFLEHNNNAATTVALTIPETGYEKNWTRARTKRQEVNELIKQFAAESEGRVLLCDFAEELPQERLSKEEMDRLWDDGLHLTPHGYDRMAEIVFQSIKYLVV